MTYSEIDVLLIPGGRKIHSRFHVPIKVSEDSTLQHKLK